MSNAQTQIEMYVLVEGSYKETPTTQIFTSLEAALTWMASTYYGEEDGFEDFCAECREADGGIFEFGDDYASIQKSEITA